MLSINDCPETVIGCQVNLNCGKPRLKMHADGTMSFLGGDFHKIPEDMLEKIVRRFKAEVKAVFDKMPRMPHRYPRPIGGIPRY